MKHAARENKRMYLVFYLRVFENGEFLGYVIDISPKGMMIISESELKTDRMYTLKMKLPPYIKGDDKKNYVEFKAECRWSRPDEDNADFFLSGFELNGLDENTSSLIEKTITQYRLP